MISAVLLAQDAPENVHDYYRATRERILAESARDFETLSASYIKNLEQAADYYKNKGDLINTLAAKQELERYLDQQSPLDEIPAALDAKLARFFQTFKAKWYELKADEYRKRIALNKKYAAHLENQEKTLTKQGDFDQALEIHNKRKHLETQITDLEQTLATLPAPVEAQPKSASGGNSEPRTQNSEPGTPLSRIPPELRPHLVAYYTFDEPGLRAEDNSGHAHHASVRGAQWEQNGKVGGAYEFDGKDDIIKLGRGKISEALDGASAVSFCMWIRPRKLDSGGPAEVAVALVEFVGTVGGGLSLLPGKDFTQFGSRILAGGKRISTSASALQLNQWQHIAGVIDLGGGKLSLFVDGEEKGAEEFTSTNSKYTDLKDQKHDDAIGGLPSGTGRAFAGTIDELMFFRTKLSRAQIEQLMN